MKKKNNLTEEEGRLLLQLFGDEKNYGCFTRIENEFIKSTECNERIVAYEIGCIETAIKDYFIHKRKQRVEE